MTAVIEGAQRQTGAVHKSSVVSTFTLNWRNMFQYNTCALHFHIWMDIFTPLCTCIVSHVEVKFGHVNDPHIIGGAL